MFHPGWVGFISNPFFFARRELMLAMRDLGPQLKGRVLDVGCGTKPYERYVAATSYVGLEHNKTVHSRADVFYDGTIFPFAANEFDAVLCNQVLEHVFTPEQFLMEIRRVLRAGGLLLLTVPFVWDEHEQPYDFGRYSSFGLRALLERSGFKVIQQRKTLADGRVLVQLLGGILYKRLLAPVGRFQPLVAPLVCLPLGLLGGIMWLLIPGRIDLFLDNIVLVQKVERG
jgi:SAM-dependent methyltransferase